jgi:hypothetical protein
VGKKRVAVPNTLPEPPKARGGNLKIAAVILTVICAIIPMLPSMPMIWRVFFGFMAWCGFLYLLCTEIEYLRKIPRDVMWGRAFLVTVCLLIVLWVPINSAWHTEKAAAIKGVLRVHEGESNAQNRMYQIGRSGPILIWQGAKGQSAMEFPDAAKLELSLKNRELYISTEVVDGQGKMVAKVTENQWEVSPDHSVSWDKNYTDDTLEVLDGRGTVVLQIRLLPDRVQIQGEWHDAFGNGMRIREGSHGDALLSRITGQNNLANERIKPIMKYPSREHWAEFESQ